jgi:hypothetical protein
VIEKITVGTSSFLSLKYVSTVKVNTVIEDSFACFSKHYGYLKSTVKFKPHLPPVNTRARVCACAWREQDPDGEEENLRLSKIRAHFI